ncbi:hypothetical protein S245_057451, partial [Arachis hypogaea]
MEEDLKDAGKGSGELANKKRKKGALSELSSVKELKKSVKRRGKQDKSAKVMKENSIKKSQNSELSVEDGDSGKKGKNTKKKLSLLKSEEADLKRNAWLLAYITLGISFRMELIRMQRKLPSPGFLVQVVLVDYNGNVVASEPKATGKRSDESSMAQEEYANNGNATGDLNSDDRVAGFAGFGMLNAAFAEMFWVKLFLLLCFGLLGSENGDTVNYATVVREVKVYLKKGVAAKELQSHIAAFPVSDQEKMNALLEGLFDGVEKAFGKEATKRKNHLAAAVAGDDEGSQL